MAPTIIPRRWFRFRLRSMLIAIAVVAVPLAWLAKEWRQAQYERQLAAKLENDGWKFTFGGPYDVGLYAWDGRQDWWRGLARSILGERIREVHTPYDVVDIGALSETASLHSLWIFGRKINDLGPLAGTRRLEFLSIDDASVIDLSPLARIKSLKQLRLMNSNMSDLAPLAGLINLHEIDIRGAQISDLTPLAGLKNLRHLSLQDMPVTDLHALIGLRKLEYVWLDNTSVSNLMSLAGLEGLQELSVRDTQVTSKEIDALQKALPNCRIFHDRFP